MSVENSVGYKSNLSGTCGLVFFFYAAPKWKNESVFSDTCPAGI